MATDEWVEFNGVELVNLPRTVQLAEVLGIDGVWTPLEDVQWVEEALDGTDYDDITTAPWYDAGYAPSAEFAGIIPLEVRGLDDSTFEASTSEYIVDGGTSHKPRNKTLPIVASMVIVASTDRGAEFGRNWLSRVLRGGGTRMFCSGSRLEYFRAVPPSPAEAVRAHRRDVTATRAPSITRKRSTDCSAMWWVTFTLTANDPFEYGEEIEQFTALGGAVTGPGVDGSGSLNMTEVGCPVFNYTPVYDPLHPALVPPPTSPDYYPAGWTIKDGDPFTRHWVRLNPVEPSVLNLVPIVVLNADEDARNMRITAWPADADPDDSCGWLWSVIVTYLPAGQEFVIDGEQRASYVWDGASSLVRRADSLVYGPDASPVQWAPFNDDGGLLITLDRFSGAGSDVRAALALVPKSD